MDILSARLWGLDTFVSHCVILIINLQQLTDLKNYFVVDLNSLALFCVC